MIVTIIMLTHVAALRYPRKSSYIYSISKLGASFWYESLPQRNLLYICQNLWSFINYCPSQHSLPFPHESSSSLTFPLFDQESMPFIGLWANCLLCISWSPAVCESPAIVIMNVRAGYIDM